MVKRLARSATAGRNRRVGARAFGVALLALPLMMVPTASAQDGATVEIPLLTVIRTDPGVSTLLGTTAIPDASVGLVCTVEARAENNSSVHPGNDLVVASGTQSVTLSDVEGAPGQVTLAASDITLGPDVTVTLIMGPDGVFSGGASAVVVLDCAPPPTTTTSTTTTSTTSTTTSIAATSTTSAPTTTVTTTTIAGPTTTAVPTTTTVPPEDPPLAFTGPAETLLLVVLGLVLLDLGYLSFSARKPGRKASPS